jgi:hypothetical protein
MFRRLLREPLVHFLVLGGLLFAASGFVGGGGAGVSDKKIVVTAADIGRLSQQFLRTWNRPPSAEELQTQVEEYVREEVLYRTALALGLDKDDLVIRRRLRQKMDFLMEGAIPEPQDNQLIAYFHAHEDRFVLEPTISFRQILVSDNRGTAAEHYAQQLLTKLIAAKSADLALGDPSLLPSSLDTAPLSRVSDQFGTDFAQSLSRVTLGQWSGPFRSPYGYHLVFVTALNPAHLPRFTDVRAAVEREWSTEARVAAVDAQYGKLLSEFQVEIDVTAQAAGSPP